MIYAKIKKTAPKVSVGADTEQSKTVAYLL